MAKTNSQLIKHHAQSSPPFRRKFVTSSNTSKRVRQVFTASASSSSPVKQQSQLEEDLLDGGQPIIVDALDGTPPDVDYPADISVHTKAKRYQNSDAPLLTWKQYRDEYLDACLTLEGRGQSSRCSTCPGCQQSNPTFRCCDCFGLALYCKSCIIDYHRNQPLHFLEEWKKGYFQKTTFQSVGLRIQLGHKPGILCPYRTPGHKDFVVLHVNGIHVLDLDFCGCTGALTARGQLLEVGWWPSTPLEPQSAASMALLRSFHVLNLQGHISPTDFYRGLEQMTCADGLSYVPDRLTQWMHMVRQWRHIKMAKRAGRSHDPSGIDGTPRGGLSIPCRACPHPNINLPDGWDNTPSKDQWLYALFLAEDANFKQKAQLRSDENKDPPLGPGWGTFVENKAYLGYVSQFTDQDEISHCAGFQALSLANNKQSKGLRSTGIGSVSCGRHEMYRPNGMGDLQKGERYANMDYIFFAGMMGTMPQLIFASYDIACQWATRLFTRMNASTMPEWLRLAPSTSVKFFVPKFHLPGHIIKCQAPFSFNFAPGVGRTDGEGVERNWSVLNGIARSVSMMGPGGRWDTLDDFCNFANWRKTVTLSSTLLRKMSLALPQAVIHHRALSAFTESLQSEHAEHVAEWETQVQGWELNHALPCPYNLPEQKVTLAEVKHQLSQEEHEQVEKGEAIMNIDDGSPSAFVVEGLELEETQQTLLVDIKNLDNTTVGQQTSIQRRQTNLLKRIIKFSATQKKYMPGLNRYLAELSPSPEEVSMSTPESIPLYLPSSLPADKCSLVCIAGVQEIEDRLRFAQASEALNKLRCQLMKRTYASQYKVQNVSSQRHYTRFRTLQDHTELKIKAACRQYTTARSALLVLQGPASGIWEHTLQELHRSDVRGLSEKALIEEEQQENTKTRSMAGLSPGLLAGQKDNFDDLPETSFDPKLAVGEGHRTLSWIWYTTSSEEVDNDRFTEAYLRVEWLKCRARAARWKEEILLLEEEMRRAIQFCTWKVNWWETQAHRRTTIPSHLDEGISAYATEHADIERHRLISWSNSWWAIRQRANLVLERHLKGQEDMIDVTVLEVEIEGDDHDNDDESPFHVDEE